MPTPDQFKYGILRARDLAELYYGRRMVTTLKESVLNTTSANRQTVITANPARIHYQIIIDNPLAPAADVKLGTGGAFDAGNQQSYRLPGNNNLIIERDWSAEQDVVTRGLEIINNTAGVLVSVREIILSPLPVDEEP